ncbi:hypothetical protein DIPPA_23123 [Diplonema papillatum]|nr:hypothetical protein DIPPA_23123 [Diplonema papillatum]
MQRLQPLRREVRGLGEGLFREEYGVAEAMLGLWPDPAAKASRRTWFYGTAKTRPRCFAWPSCRSTRSCTTACGGTTCPCRVRRAKIRAEMESLAPLLALREPI